MEFVKQEQPVTQTLGPPQGINLNDSLTSGLGFRRTKHADSNDSEDNLVDAEPPDPDIILVCGKREFPAHKSILTEISPYFKSMFSSEWKETSTGRVELPTINEQVMEVIVEFVYSQNLPAPVNEEMWDLYLQVLQSAHLLEITSLFLNCLRILTDYMGLNNFPQLFHVAGLYGNVGLDTKNAPRVSSEGLAARIDTFLAQRFSKYSETPEFIKMNVEQLKSLLQHSDLEALSLYSIMESILKWVEAKPESRKVQLEDILFILNPCFGELVGELVLCWTNNPDIKSFRKTIQGMQAKVGNCKSCGTSSVEVHKLLFYGGDRIAGHRIMKTYDTKTETWQANNHPPFPILDGIEAVAYSGHICFFGVKGWMKVYSEKVTTYCPQRNCVVWTGSLKYPVRVCGAVSLQGAIYVIGVRETAKNNMNAVQKFWPATGKCECVANIDDDTRPSKTYVWGNNVYVVSYSGDRIHMYLVRYEPLTDQWTQLTNVPKRFSSFTFTLFNGKFLLMKRDNKFVYDIASNEWEETKFSKGPINLEEMWTIWHNGKRLLLARDKDFTLATFELDTSEWNIKVKMEEFMQDEPFNSQYCGLLKCLPY